MPEEYDENAVEELLKIPVIGELKARAILKAGYDSADSLEEASMEELAEIEGIGEESAQEIKDSLDGEGEEETEEMICPGCGAIVGIQGDSCRYCDRELEIKGDVYIPEGVIEEALKVLADMERKIMDGEENAKIWYQRGAVLEKLGADEEALKAFDRVIELDPLYDQIWTAKAHLALNLGLMNEAAKAFKVAVESRSIDIPEAALETEEEEEEIKKEHAIEVEKVVSKVSDARSAMAELRGGHLPLVYLEEGLEGIIEARNRDDREEVVEKTDDFLSEVSKAKKVTELVEEGYKELERLKVKGMNTQRLEKEFDEVYSLVEGGRFEEAKNEASRVVEDVIKKEEEEGMETHLSDEALEDDLEEIFSEAKRKLSEARDTKMNIDKIKECVRKTSKARKSGDIEEALDRARESRDEAEAVIEISNKVERGKRLIKDLKDKNIDYQPYLNTMKEAKEEADEGDYETSLHLLESAIEEIREDVQEEEKKDELISSLESRGEEEEKESEEEKKRTEKEIGEEVSEEEIEEIRSYLNDVEKIRDKLLMLDMELDDEDHSLDEAEGMLDSGEVDGARDKAKEVKEDLLNLVNKALSERVKGAKEKLKKAKLEGDIDVSRCIHLLKQAKKAREKGDMEKVLSYLDDYRRELESGDGE